MTSAQKMRVAPSNGFEPLTFRLTGGRSTRLSYDGIVVVQARVRVSS